MWLAIDTSSARASVAWVDPTRAADPPEWRSHAVAGRQHNRLLFPLLAEAFEQPCARSLSAIVVGTGPGSYTGTRIGIASALGLALQRPGIRIFPWHSLTTLHANDCEANSLDSYLWLSDARRQRFGIAEVRARTLDRPVQLCSQSEAANECGTALATGLPLLTADDHPDDLGDKLGLPPGRVLTAYPDPAMLALQVASLTSEEQECLASREPSPVYLAAPYITRPRER